MSKQPVNFTTSAQGGSDLDDLFIRRALFTHGGLWLWGNNNYGAIGNNTNNVGYSSPVQTISGGANWKQVSISSDIAAGIKTDGTLWMWGYNGEGELGDNSSTDKSSPVQTVSGGTNWKYISVGYDHTGAIKTDGTLWLWGANTYGQLGNNANGTHKSSPVQTVSSGTNWQQISCGRSSTAAIKIDGTLWLWGYNIYGQLGDGTQADKSSPVQTVAGGNNWKYVSSGWSHVGAIKTDGTLWLWGNGTFGSLGDNTNSNTKSSPVQTVAGGSNWKQVSCSAGTTAAIKTDGTLWMWGSNDYGNLGDNSINYKSSPVQTVAGGSNWKQVSCNAGTTAAIKTDGTLWMWGYNGSGNLGNNAITDKSSPVQTVAGGSNWKQVSVGEAFTSGIRENN